jgi:hypothetical protein
MKTPTLEEVKEYFKNAKQVIDLANKQKINIDLQSIHHDYNSFWTKCCDRYYIVWNNGKYAEIISYIDPTYTLTKEQVIYLHSLNECKEQIEEWFPEFKKPSLEVGKWYKNIHGAMWFYQGNNIKTYGFTTCNTYFNTLFINWEFGNWTLATPQEVEEALTKEAVKRGYEMGVKVKDIGSKNITNISKSRFDFYPIDNDAYMGGAKIFDNGIWAEIISEPIELTLDQVAEKFGYDVSQIKIVK